MTAAQPVLDRVRTLCLSLPETSEARSWGHPNFRAGKKTFVAWEQIKDRPSIAFRLEGIDIELLLRRKQFFVTPYGRGQWVSVWADGRLNWRQIADLVRRSYLLVANKRMMTALDEARPEQSRTAGGGRGGRSKNASDRA